MGRRRGWRSFSDAIVRIGTGGLYDPAAEKAREEAARQAKKAQEMQEAEIKKMEEEKQRALEMQRQQAEDNADRLNEINESNKDKYKNQSNGIKDLGTINEGSSFLDDEDEDEDANDDSIL